MIELGRNARRLVCELAVSLPCVWTGYFLTHTWKTLDTEQLLLLGSGAALCVGGAALAGTLRHHRGNGAPMWCLAGLVALGILLTALANFRALFAAGPLLVVATLRSNEAWSAPGARCALGLLFACASISMGPVIALPVSGQVILLGLALAVYVGLAETTSGDPPVTRPTFGMLLGLIIALVLMMGAIGLARPHGLLGAALAAWLAARLGIVGARVLRQYTSRRVHSFAKQAQLGTGLMAGILLTLTIKGNGRSEVAELAWPVVAGVFSFLLMRVWPLLVKDGGEYKRDHKLD